MSSLYPLSPDFSFLDGSTSQAVESAYKTVFQKEAFKILKEFDGESFMFSNDPKILAIMTDVNDAYPGHSGASLAFAMRHIEFIAKNGFDNYRNHILSSS
jgi:hypothetical protein